MSDQSDSDHEFEMLEQTLEAAEAESECCGAPITETGFCSQCWEHA
jgi:hypothetical protein